MMHRSKQRGVLEGPMLYVMVGLGVALAASWAASGAAIWYLDGKVEKAQGEATEAKAARAKEQQSREGFQAAASACDAGVRGLQADAEAREAAWERRLNGSREETAQAEELVKAIIARQRPAGMDECTAARKELDDEVDRRRPKP